MKKRVDGSDFVLKLGGHDKNVKRGFLPSITGNQPCHTANTSEKPMRYPNIFRNSKGWMHGYRLHKPWLHHFPKSSASEGPT
jgi:hypothetical protein